MSTLFGDVYIVNGSKKVKMTPLKSAKVDFATFRTIAHIDTLQKDFYAIGTGIEKGSSLLHFRLASISFSQKNYALCEDNSQAMKDEEKYCIDFHTYAKQKNVMLQLFYKKKWYGLLLGSPIKTLHKLFHKLDIDSPDLNIKEVQKYIKEARRAFPLDDKLKTIEMELNNRAANEFNKTSNHMQQGIIF